jgi:hypothetical protein
MNLKDTGFDDPDWIYLAQDSVQLPVRMDTLWSLPVLGKAGKVLD